MDSTRKFVSVSPVVTEREKPCVVGDWERERLLVCDSERERRPCVVGDWERDHVWWVTGKRPCVVRDWERDHVWWVTGRERETIGG